MSDEPLNPVERLRVALYLDDQMQDGDAFSTVDFLMQEYLLTNEPLTKSAEDLREMLAEVIAYWTPKE